MTQSGKKFIRDQQNATNQVAWITWVSNNRWDTLTNPARTSNLTTKEILKEDQQQIEDNIPQQSERKVTTLMAWDEPNTIRIRADWWKVDEKWNITYTSDSGRTTTVSAWEYENRAKEQAEKLPELEQMAQKTEWIEIEKESRPKRFSDTLIKKISELNTTPLLSVPTLYPIAQLYKNMAQSRVNQKESDVFLSDWKLITSVPKIQDADTLTDMKDLATNILQEYAINWNVVTAKQIKEKYPQYKNIADQILDNYVWWAIGAYTSWTPINRDIVAKNYSTMSIMEWYTGERQHEIDMLTDDDIMRYWISEDLYRQIQNDENTQELITAYNTVKFYVDQLNKYWLNYTWASDRKIANTYRYKDIQYEWIMSLDEAMNIIENYDQNRLNSLVGAIKDRYDNVIDREIDKSTLAKNNEQLYNILDQAHSLVQFVDESFDYATDDFLEYVAEQNAQEPTALKITPASRMGDLITKFISGNMYMDDNWNYRNLKWEVEFTRQPDWSYVNKKWKTVQELTWLQKWWLRNNVNALTSVLEWATDLVEWSAMAVTWWVGKWYWIQAITGALSSAVNFLMLSKWQKFMALSSTPGRIGQWTDFIFQSAMEIWWNTIVWLFDLLQLTDTYTDESKESLKELWWLLIVSALSKKLWNSPMYKRIKKAAIKVWNKRADLYLQIKWVSELKDNVRKDNPALEDKTEIKDIFDETGKKVWELKPEKSETKTETKSEKSEKPEKSETKSETKTTERLDWKEVIDQTSTKDKIWYSLELNKLVAKEMVDEFRNELKKIEKEENKNSYRQELFDTLSENPELKELKEALFWKTQSIFSAFLEVGKNILSALWSATRRIAKDIVKYPARKTINRVYREKMKLAESSINTIENNSKIGQLWKIFHELIWPKWERKENIKNIEKYVKERVAQIREEEARRIQQALEKYKKDVITSQLFQKLDKTKNINFSKFFTSQNWIMQALKEMSAYVSFVEIGWKIYMKWIEWHWTYYDEIVRPKIKEIVDIYNDAVEKWKISEDNISKINDVIKELTSDSQPNKIKSIWYNLLSAFEQYLSDTGIANKILQWNKAAAEIHKLYKMFDWLYKEPKWPGKQFTQNKLNPNKIIKFLENLSEEQIDALEKYVPWTRETIDLLKNGATVVKEFANRFKNWKEIETRLSQKSKDAKSRTKDVNAWFLKLVWLFASRSNSPKLWLIATVLWWWLWLTTTTAKGGAKVRNKIVNNKVRKHLQKALDWNKEKAKQLENQASAVEQWIKKVNDAIDNVVKSRERIPPDDTPPTSPAETKWPTWPTWPQWPNRRPYDTSHPNREEYDPNAPIFRNGEDKQQPSEQRDNDMVVSEQETLPEEKTKALTDERQYLEVDPEYELETAMENLKTYTKDMLNTLRDLLSWDDTDDWWDGWNWPKTPESPESPETPETPKWPETDKWTDKDINTAIETIDDFINEMNETSPEESEWEPIFSSRSNEMIAKLHDKEWNFYERVPEEYIDQIRMVMQERATKKENADETEMRDKNNLIKEIIAYYEWILDGKNPDDIHTQFDERVQETRFLKDTSPDVASKAYDIVTDIIDWNLKESNVYQDKTSYEGNKIAAWRIKKWSWKDVTPTKSASKASTLDVRNTKKDTPGKLNALKAQLEKKKKVLPNIKTYKTRQKKQEEIDKLQAEIDRLEKLFWNNEKPQVVSSENEQIWKENTQTEQSTTQEEKTSKSETQEVKYKKVVDLSTKTTPEERKYLRSVYNEVEQDLKDYTRLGEKPTEQTQKININWQEVPERLRERAGKWIFKTKDWYLIPLYHWGQEFWMYDTAKAWEGLWGANEWFWMFFAIDYTFTEIAAQKTVALGKRETPYIWEFYTNVKNPIMHPQAIIRTTDDIVQADQMLMKYYETVDRLDFIEKIKDYADTEWIESLSEALENAIYFAWDIRQNKEFRWDSAKEMELLKKAWYDSIIFDEWFLTIAIFEPNKHVKRADTNPENIEWLTNEAQEYNILDVYFQENKNQIFEDLENIEKQEYWSKKTAFDYAMELNPEKATREELTLARREIQDRLEDKQLWKRNQKAVERKLEEVREAFRNQRLKNLSDNNQNE
jgi:hypothetical protein